MKEETSGIKTQRRVIEEETIFAWRLINLELFRWVFFIFVTKNYVKTNSNTKLN